jgi:anti-sigma regulatory factor (Ser/Thr protein kinase)
MNGVLTTSLAVVVKEISQVGEARRLATHLAAQVHLDEIDKGRVALVATELANNLQMHAGGGTLLLRPVNPGPGGGVEIMAIDQGPGMADVARCLEDGYSTRGTPGTGLGSVKRLSSLMEIYSLPGKLTVVLAQVRPSGAKPPVGLEIGAVSVAVEGEPVCGDGWTERRDEKGTSILVVDGLGHGTGAADAAQAALRLFEEGPGSGLELTLHRLHDGLRSTRGAAAMVLQVDPPQKKVTCAGIGNIAGCLSGPVDSRNFVSHNGIVGHQSKRVQEFTYPWEDDALLILHSDGINSRWRLDAYAGLRHRHPSVIAAVLYLDFRRERDDATVLVARKNARAIP